LSAHYLLASLWWGSAGVGLLVYAKKQMSLAALLGGLTLLGISYFASSAIQMHLVGVAVVLVMWMLRRSEES
jgi:hypothetical protein